MPEPEDQRLSAIGSAMQDGEIELDPRLERLVYGQLSPEDLAQLRADSAHDETLAAAIEMLEPASPALEDKLVDVALDSARPSPPTVERDASIISLRHWAPAAATLAAAAAIAFAWLPSSPPASLPPFTATVESSQPGWRGPTDNDARERTLSIVLRPETTVEDKALEARLFVIGVDGAAQRLDVAADVRRGVARWQVAVAEIAPIDAQHLTLIAVVARPGFVPDAETVARASSGSGWQSDRIEVALRSPKRHAP